MQVRSTKHPTAASAAKGKTAARTPAKAHAAKPKPASSFTAGTSGAKRSHAVDPAREFSDFTTRLGSFVQLDWEPLMSTLKAYDQGHIAPTAAGHSSEVPVPARQIEAELNAYLERPEVKSEMYAKANIYEVEERFLSQWGVMSRDDLSARLYSNTPGYVHTPRTDPNPLFGASKRIAEQAQHDPKYAALLDRVKRDPLTLVLLTAATGKGDATRLKPHETALMNDLVELKTARGQMSGHDDNTLSPGAGGWYGPDSLHVKLDLEGKARDAMRELNQAQKLIGKSERLERALEGLSLRRPPFGA